MGKGPYGFVEHLNEPKYFGVCYEYFALGETADLSEV